MTLQTILNRLQKLHPKEIDLSLDRVRNLCKKLGNPQKDLKYISVVGTNGKYSTIQAIRAILKEANIISISFISSFPAHARVYPPLSLENPSVT